MKIGMLCEFKNKELESLSLTV